MTGRRQTREGLCSSTPPGRSAALMVDFGIGVNSVNTYEIKRVDTDYFAEE
jgi:hypothetical protein